MINMMLLTTFSESLDVELVLHCILIFYLGLKDAEKWEKRWNILLRTQVPCMRILLLFPLLQFLPKPQAL